MKLSIIFPARNIYWKCITHTADEPNTRSEFCDVAVSSDVGDKLGAYPESEATEMASSPDRPCTRLAAAPHRQTPPESPRKNQCAPAVAEPPVTVPSTVIRLAMRSRKLIGARAVVRRMRRNSAVSESDAFSHADWSIMMTAKDVGRNQINRERSARSLATHPAEIRCQ